MAEKFKNLNAQELALIVNRLQVPLIARDYLDANIEPENDTKYALHELMSNLEPSMALLCASVTLQEIALSNEGLTFLNEFCSSMIEKYGPEALHGKDNPTDIATDLLQISEDLEQVIELMDMCRMSFEIVRPETLAFINIMLPQMESQTVIVDELIKMTSTKNHSKIRNSKFSELPVTA